MAASVEAKALRPPDVQNHSLAFYQKNPIYELSTCRLERERFVLLRVRVRTEARPVSGYHNPKSESA
jgi:hypothetical protein